MLTASKFLASLRNLLAVSIILFDKK